MRQNICKIGLVLCAIKMVMSYSTRNTYSNLQQDVPDNINMKPFVKVGTKYYHLGDTKVTWHNAYSICRSLGGFLASLETSQEATQLSDYLNSKYSTNKIFWLSASDQDVEGQWYWYNTGEVIIYANWDAGQPDNYKGNENCAQLLKNGGKYKMNDVHCGLRQYYICETDEPKLASVGIY
ncbi:C-type lectin 37Db-like [Lucilia sericata]|uniref:C-type lectin 37Db-like n=1 Tax=Lucilia sericata TaxID=13632 RepID=UPI0018A837F4|nr:C-type lectin 37Db-like [Lucilia sericata]